MQRVNCEKVQTIEMFNSQSHQRTDIINKLAITFGYKSYLEIGVSDPESNFNKIRAEYKVSVDPRKDYQFTHNLTSDEFFAINQDKFDLIFIDGLHHQNQVYRDIQNALKALSEGGTIVCHDMSPPNEDGQKVPQIVGEWCGDCWKAWMKHRIFYSNLNMFVVDTDYGVGIIRKGIQSVLPIDLQLNWENLVANRVEWLNLISVDRFEKWLENPCHFVDSHS